MSTAFVSTRLPAHLMPWFQLSLRARLLAVALLGVISCTVALYGLGRLLQITARIARSGPATR